MAMKVGESIKVRRSYCIECGKLLDGASAVDDEGRIQPSPGDATICIYCGHLMVFDEKQRLRNPTREEMIEFAGDRRILMIQRARGNVAREKDDAG